MCTVVNKYHTSFDVYIGRGSIWGNPFPITKKESRELVIEKYRIYLWEQIRQGKVTIEDLQNLNGKRC